MSTAPTITKLPVTTNSSYTPHPDLPQRKKPGRKPNPNAAELRKVQNRAAQRAFRERREKHMRELEDQLQKLRETEEQRALEFRTLQQSTAQIDAENTMLRKLAVVVKELGVEVERIEKGWKYLWGSGEETVRMVEFLRGLTAANVKGQRITTGPLSPPSLSSSPSSSANSNLMPSSLAPLTSSPTSTDIDGSISPLEFDPEHAIPPDPTTTSAGSPPSFKCLPSIQPTQNSTSVALTTTRYCTNPPPANSGDAFNLSYITSAQSPPVYPPLSPSKPPTELQRLSTVQTSQRLQYQCDRKLDPNVSIPPVDAIAQVAQRLRVGQNIPETIMPTVLQQMIPHDERIDVIPCPHLRDNMIMFADSYDIDAVCYDLLAMSTCQGDPMMPYSWGLKDAFYEKYPFLLCLNCPRAVRRMASIKFSHEQRVQILAYLKQQHHIVPLFRLVPIKK
ncbi:uncharacterized protein VTP21DRAFT_4680 [Calcarisporiella thermophila]|uniref:uncharacterized protein n=1 Tax=Calcarisporiella thermophila TaxID=911321 RepID=UPI0037426950